MTMSDLYCMSDDELGEAREIAIPQIVLVTGPMRSGTSLVAGVLHRLGWCAAVKLAAPGPPSWRLEWEDVDMTVELINGRRPTPGAWIEYLADRARHSAAMGFGGRITVKSPYLALVWENLIRVAPDALVIRTYREEEGLARSMAAHPQLGAQQQEAIGRALLKITPTVELGYDYSVDYPERMVRGLAQRLEVEDPVAIQAAIAMIGRPTEYPCATQPQAR